jgi:hypothetical protein
MKKLLVSAALSGAALFGWSATAWAVPNPNPSGPAHTGTACSNVFTNNPNAGPNPHISPTGGANFFNVGAAFCGL